MIPARPDWISRKTGPAHREQLSRTVFSLARNHVYVSPKDWTILFVLDVLATVVGILAYVAVGGSF